MFSLIVIFRLQAEKKSIFLDAITPVIEQTRGEIGNLQYQLSVDELDESRYFLYETYVDRTAYELHTSMGYLTTLRETLNEILLEMPTVIRGIVVED